MLPPATMPSRPTISTAGLGPPALGRPGAQRYFFVALAWFYAVVAGVGFAPNLHEYFAGTYKIHPIAWAHGAIMTAWLVRIPEQGDRGFRSNVTDDSD